MIEALGLQLLQTADAVLEIVNLAASTAIACARQCMRWKFRGRETIDQLFEIGVESVPIVGICLLFISFMMIAEFSFHMKMILRQDSLVPAFATVLMLRELGPLLTCFLLTSRVGASMAAEIGMMKITEQLDALKLLGIPAVDYVVVPRLLAFVLGGVALSIIAAAIAIFGGALIASGGLGYNVEQYFQVMFLYTRFGDVVTCMIKGAVFGCIIPLVASFQGFRCAPGSEGVGNAATRAVVQSSMAIIISDFLLTYLLYAV